MEATPGLQLYIPLGPFEILSMRHSKELGPYPPQAEDSMCIVSCAHQPYFVLPNYPRIGTSCPKALGPLSDNLSPSEDLPSLPQAPLVAFSSLSQQLASGRGQTKSEKEEGED